MIETTHRSTTTRLAAVLLAGGLAFGVAACSSKSNTDATSNEAQSTGTNADGTPATDAAGRPIGRLGTLPHGEGTTTSTAGTATTPVSESTTTSSTTTTVGVTITTAPTTTTTHPPTTPTTAHVDTTPSTAAHLDPETAAKKLYDAWQAGDQVRAHLYASNQAVTDLFSHGTSSLAFDHCEGAMGSTYCTFSKPGVTLIMRVSNGTGDGTVQVTNVTFS